MNSREIDNLVFDILRKSKALDVYPTPVDKIVQYCELSLTNKSTFHSSLGTYIAKNADAFQRMIKKVIGALDRTEHEIYIDPSLPPIKQTFVKLHEVGHSAIPWQKDVKYADDAYTLSPEVKEIFECEANYFASGSLFQLDRFEDEMNRLPLEIGSPMALAKKFGGSNHAAIRRYAEICKKRCALIVLEDKERTGNKYSLDLRNSFQSASFTKDFGEITWPEKLNTDYPFIADYSRGRRVHKDGTIQLVTNAGFEEFTYHYFFNKYNVFILIMPVGEKIKSRTKILIAAQP